jgi:type III restriction enzyme
MADAAIDNPILNQPFAEPRRYFRFGDDGITNEIIEGRRPSSYFVPIPPPKKKSQMALEPWTADRVMENELVNAVRARVALWRADGRSGVTTTTRRLLEYWTDPHRDRPLFFCQVEALETAIWLAEVASKRGEAFVENRLREEATAHNPGIFRVAFKMATGSGKTLVMASLIAWQALNKAAAPRDARFTDSFLVVTPGITIRDRLRVLLPQDPDTYYRALDLVPPTDLEQLGAAKIVITNFHPLQLRDRGDASKTTKQILARGGESPFRETPDEMASPSAQGARSHRRSGRRSIRSR